MTLIIAYFFLVLFSLAFGYLSIPLWVLGRKAGFLFLPTIMIVLSMLFSALGIICCIVTIITN
jgi:hypothetical protein